ncbi:MAG: hypothetical protein A2944_02360 [Candidatus Zambryskibacteria bacterium RIFCSPLOWO2_01_FULL_52_12]|nr:MAG: hypothetical protein A2944_02360 [Candidatus Zambryskibacteria bacterium RIFCSPLOWO2_01_FULL_52_12]
MQPGEIAIMEKLLLSYSSHVDVLEWGSGGSTVYFTRFLRKKGISYTWESVEYNKLWYEKILAELKGDKHTSLTLFDIGNNENKQREELMNEYVAYPATLGKKFDIIIVDGRKRRRCLIEATQLLKPGGTVLLHDGRRTYYHCAFKHYPDSRILSRSGLWRGKLEDPGFLSRAFNALLYWLFRTYTFSFRFFHFSHS